MGNIIDCAFRVNERRCSALTKKFCGRCKFYKTAEELQEGRDKAEERIRSLPKRVQMEIHDKYCVGGGDDEEQR